MTFLHGTPGLAILLAAFVFALIVTLAVDAWLGAR